MTTGNFAGADIVLARRRGRPSRHRHAAPEDLALDRFIGHEDQLFEAGGLGRAVRVFRLPDENPHRSMEFVRTVDVAASGDTPVYVRVTLENGHQAWSSPIYLFHQP